MDRECKRVRNAMEWPNKLSDEEIKWFFRQPCYYCAAKAESQPRRRSGLDRFDGAKLYDLDTVVPCCYVCNRGKRDMKLQEYVEFLARLVTNIQNRKKEEEENAR